MLFTKTLISTPPPSLMNDTLIPALQHVVGAQRVRTDATDLAPLELDCRGRYRGTALCAVYPGTTQEVADVVRTCAAHNAAIVPQGGNTGMCGAATPDASRTQVIVRLDRLNRIRHSSALDNTMVAEAGCILADIQRHADSIDRLFPLSLGAEDSCQIGGNIATNAGGTAVLRYGPMRDLVLGLEVVLPDGRVLNDLKRLRKDSTGYAVRQWFIGAEGTLGIVTAAALKLFPKPHETAAAMAALRDLDAALQLLAELRGVLSDRLSAFEVMSASQMDLVCSTLPGLSSPFASPAPWYLLIEAQDAMLGTGLAERLERALHDALARGLIDDAVIPTSEAQRAALWELRHSVTEANQRAGVSASYDTAVPLEKQAAFYEQTRAGIQAAFPQARVLYVGHLGDGNLHAIAHFDHDAFPDPQDKSRAFAAIDRIVDEATAACDGTLSAEHGVGLSHRHRLASLADPVRLSLMHDLKAMLDPRGLLNPGKVLPDARPG